MAARIAVVDYCKGNLASVQRGLADAGFDAFITADAEDIAAADGIVLPGVGAFADAMNTMNSSGQAHALRKALADDKPFLGICLGLHLLFEWGDEGCPQGERIEGLGALPGHVQRVESIDASGAKHKVPHVGWNSVDFVEGTSCPIFEGIGSGSYFYFTHSYNVVADRQSDVVATTCHAQRFACAVRRGNVFGVQFHPEKSSALGLRVLTSFGKLVEQHASGAKALS